MRAVVAAQGVGGVELFLAEAAGMGTGLDVQAEDVLALHRLCLEGGAAVLAEEGALRGVHGLMLLQVSLFYA